MIKVKKITFFFFRKNYLLRIYYDTFIQHKNDTSLIFLIVFLIVSKILKVKEDLKNYFGQQFSHKNIFNRIKLLLVAMLKITHFEKNYFLPNFLCNAFLYLLFIKPFLSVFHVLMRIWLCIILSSYINIKIYFVHLYIVYFLTKEIKFIIN